MAAGSTGSAPVRRSRRRLQAWLQMVAVAAALLGVSEVVWVWQTWPVRELLQQPLAPAHPGRTP